jgi:nucleotide-binding universal stress UspA family protein
MTEIVKCVLVATDGSASSLRAEAVAIGIAAGCRSRLLIVTISRGLPSDEIRRLAHTEGDVSKARHALIRQILEAAQARAKEAGVADSNLVSDRGDPAATILAIAKREEADLVVIGRRGVGAISQLLLGSVSKSIVDSASCAVASVP